jgi:hypothetical protein
VVPRELEWHGSRGRQGLSVGSQWLPPDRGARAAGPMRAPTTTQPKERQPPSVRLPALACCSSRWQLRLASGRPSLIQCLAERRRFIQPVRRDEWPRSRTASSLSPLPLPSPSTYPPPHASEHSFIVHSTTPSCYPPLYLDTLDAPPSDSTPRRRSAPCPTSQQTPRRPILDQHCKVLIRTGPRHLDHHLPRL